MTPFRHTMHRSASLKTAAMAFVMGVAGTLVLALPLSATAASGPSAAWKLSLSSMPTNFTPGAINSRGIPNYYLSATNIGSEPTAGTITILDTLPAGLTPTEAQFGSSGSVAHPFRRPCEISGQTVTCTVTVADVPGVSVAPGGALVADIGVDVASLPENSTLLNTATISGGGADAANATTTTTVSSTPAPFGFLAGLGGLGASPTDSGGSPVTEAGSHPYQLTVNLGFNAIDTGEDVGAGQLEGAGGGVRDVRTVLPRGLVVDPSATPVLCTEAQLESDKERCPAASAVGVANVVTTLVGTSFPEPNATPLYNMVAPAGTAAEFGFDVAGAGYYVHIDGGVRAGDYALSASSDDILARNGNPILGVQVQLWGDPSAPAHNIMRGTCAIAFVPGGCPVQARTTPLLTMPTACSDSLRLDASADSWFDPGHFVAASSPVTDFNGDPIGVAGCNGVEFSPSLRARPTTSAADSPTGLEVDLRIPQTNSLSARATAHLRKAVVTLPEGLVVNPSSANGLAACSSNQIGIDPASGVANGNKPACPAASRIGTVEVDTPLLDHPLPGAVYIATPHDNPFDSLLAIYIAVDDAQTGIVVKLAGHVAADPRTGRLTTTFDENPQLPFSDFKLDFFGGAAAALRTPTVCSVYSTSSELTPWSAPDSGPPATPQDTYAISQGAGGSACPGSEGAEPNSPSFDAGSVSPIAGAYTPFVVNLRRNDGSQQFSSVTVTPPPGLVGKLAGVPYCPEAALAAAAAKTGNQEKASPSCPDASLVGTATVGAGAGPAPYYATGKAYLTGPYKGAPLSLAIVTPATAGPYDLGTVVVRTALNVNPETAQITAVSDPIPRILQGIPLDVRSVSIALDRPGFSLNPTSCDPFAVSGQLVSTLGQAASLSSRFQVAECGRLGFKPGLSVSLKGPTKRSKNPALKAVLTYPKGAYANIRSASVALPHSEFLDQSHIKTICTRVQFAVQQCPAGAIYGNARAVTPLLDSPLEGPVYLRSSSHPLPDLVADLHGQIHVVLVGRIDSVDGGIRTTFESVPDAPVSGFVLEMPGGKKSLLENSTNLCKSVNRASASFVGQNGKAVNLKPVLKSSCKRKGSRRARR